MIFVYKTSVQKQSEANRIIQSLEYLMPKAKINFDLEDKDCILRIEKHFMDDLDHFIIQKTVEDFGFSIEKLS